MENEIFGILQSLGINISSGAFLEFLKEFYLSRKTETKQELEERLDAYLKIHGVSVRAATVIDAFASQGLLSIHGSTLYAPQQIAIGAAQGAKFTFGSSVSQTDKTAVQALGNASIDGTHSEFVQRPNGDITFHVGSAPGSTMTFSTGPGSSINFMVPKDKK